MQQRHRLYGKFDFSCDDHWIMLTTVECQEEIAVILPVIKPATYLPSAERFLGKWVTVPYLRSWTVCSVSSDIVSAVSSSSRFLLSLQGVRLIHSPSHHSKTSPGGTRQCFCQTIPNLPAAILIQQLLHSLASSSFHLLHVLRFLSYLLYLGQSVPTASTKTSTISVHILSVPKNLSFHYFSPSIIYFNHSVYLFGWFIRLFLFPVCINPQSAWSRLSIKIFSDISRY